MEALTTTPDDSLSLPADDYLFGWNPTPGIVSVWATRTGKALVWQRIGNRISCTRETFHPWLFQVRIAFCFLHEMVDIWSVPCLPGRRGA
jgi:hypothetical protein